MLTAFALAATAAVVYADFKDYRGLMREFSPYSFESTADLSALYPGSVIIFSKGQPLLWEASGIGDYKVTGGEISAIAQNGLASLPNGQCGGLLVPENTESIIYKDDIMVASTPDIHYSYYVPDCARYSESPREGSYIDTAGGLLCEASYTDRIIRNAYTGEEIYRDRPDSPTQAIYGINGSCYYLQRNGNIDTFGGAMPRMESFSYMEGMVYAATYEHGFSGFTKKGYFTLKISSWGAAEFNFLDLPDNGLCMPAYDSAEPFCEARFAPGFVDTALKAERITLTNDAVILKTGDKMTAYGREDSWIKELVTRYALPAPCVLRDALYYRDVLGDEWQINLNTMEDPVRVSFIPASCDPAGAYYKDGAIFMSDGAFVYRYAELARQQGGRQLYRTQKNSKMLYFNE